MIETLTLPELKQLKLQMAFNPCETTEYWLEVKAFLQQ